MSCPRAAASLHVASLLILICLLGMGAALRMPIDIFPGDQHSGGQRGLDL
jgi:hypothetical protein